MSLEILQKGLAVFKKHKKAKGCSTGTSQTKREDLRGGCRLKLRSQEVDWEIHGGDNNEENDLKPSRKEALQAAATLRKYIADFDDPFAQKMEGVLSLFGCETRRKEVRTMVNLSIYNYFTYT
jgi:hypothetical protein